eukprot:scaffold654_cov207-Ochromonas_danica.AAC.58
MGKRWGASQVIALAFVSQLAVRENHQEATSTWTSLCCARDPINIAYVCMKGHFVEYLIDASNL